MNKRKKSLSPNLPDNTNPQIKDSPRLQTNRLSASKEIDRDKNVKATNTSPGPGAYNLSTLFNNKKGLTMSSLPRSPKNNEQHPDPWSYIPKSNFIQARSPNATIGRQRKVERFINAPGPADYRANYNILLQRSRMPVISNTQRERHIQAKPGPGDYDTSLADQLLKKNTSVRIGNQEREDRSNSKSPAPNQYKIDDQFSLKAKNKTGFTMGSRVRCKTETDAPLNYLKYNAQKNVILSKSPAFTIKRSKNTGSQINLSPGPAAYSPKAVNKHQTHGIVIPRSQRTFYQNKVAAGIGTYDITIAPGSPSYSIPRAPLNDRESRFSYLPGPGDYTPELPKTQKFKWIGIGMGGKYSFAEEESPGPGDYNIITGKPQRGFTIGHGEREAGRGSEGRPGPADYHTEYNVISKFISSKRKK